MPPLIRWLCGLNVVLVCAIGLVVGMLFFIFPDDNPSPSSLAIPQNKAFPKDFFAQSKTAYAAIGKKNLSLKWTTPKMQLPDLRDKLLFYGKNNRPDVPSKEIYLQVGLEGSDDVRSITPGRLVYLVYQLSDNPGNTRLALSSGQPLWGEIALSSRGGSYLFSPNNQPTSLWFEMTVLNNKTVEVSLCMLDEEGKQLFSPANLKNFPLLAQNFPKSKIAGWNLEGHRVDSTLLVRQKARWIGPDCFLELHGGKEFAFTKGRERIDFLDPAGPYSCFIKEKEFLFWKEKRWQRPQPQEKTMGFPLMMAKKIDKKIMALEIWHPEGKGKTLVNLIHSQTQSPIPNLSQEFTFVGAKTWAQYVVECRGGDRMTLKSNDWLLLTQDGWKKLDSSEEIDDYVEQRLVGPLFVLDKLTRHEGRQVLLGHLFNATRTEVEEITLTTTSNNLTSLANSMSLIQENIKMEESAK